MRTPRYSHLSIGEMLPTVFRPQFRCGIYHADGYNKEISAYHKRSSSFVFMTSRVRDSAQIKGRRGLPLPFIYPYFPHRSQPLHAVRQSQQRGHHLLPLSFIWTRTKGYPCFRPLGGSQAVKASKCSVSGMWYACEAR